MKSRKLLATGLVAAMVVGALALTGCGPKEDASNGAGGESSELSGSLTIEGSDTMVNVGQAWAEKFQEVNPGVMVSVKGGGSGNGIAAIINGTVDFANSSRAIKDEEKAEADKAGVNPVEHVVAQDGIVVALHPSNSVGDITLDQLGKVFRGEITNWKDLGGKDAKIVLLGRDTSSGTYEFFKEAVVGKERDYAKTMRNLTSNQEIVAEVEANENAIGYVGIGYANEAGDKIARVKVDGQEATIENVKSKAYPLSRDLYMYTNGDPADLAKAYLDWILGAEGQTVVEEQGFVSVD